jgi:hypothetical protein
MALPGQTGARRPIPRGHLDTAIRDELVSAGCRSACGSPLAVRLADESDSSASLRQRRRRVIEGGVARDVLDTVDCEIVRRPERDGGPLRTVI